MFKKLRFLFFLSLLFLPSPVLAGSPGLNLINNPNSFGYVPDSGLVSSWMTYIPETPEHLNTVSIPAPNIIVRLHAAWTDTGKNMLSADYSVQENTARNWCSSLNSLAARKDSVYAIPFNELSHSSERQSPTGTISLDEAIVRAKHFMGILDTCLSGVTLTSPALDPHNADFPTTSQAFSDRSVIAYHSYSPDTTHSYNSGPLAGKHFIFSEVGTLVDGQVVYDDCALVKHFCSQHIAQFLQQESNIIAYTLFTFSPGDYSGKPWTLENPDVVHALANDCDNLTTLDPDTCRIGDTHLSGSTLCGPVHPQDSSHTDPVGAPYCSEHPYVDTVKNYPPKNSYCSFSIPVSETRTNSNYTPPASPDPAAPTPIPAGDITVHTVEENKNYTGSRLPQIYQNIAALFWETDPPDIFTSKNIHTVGPDTRASTYKETQVKKDITLLQAVLSLGDSADTTAFDVQIGWACSSPQGGNWCYKNPLPDQACRPIYISEIAAQGLNEGNQAIKILTDQGEITQLWTSQITNYNQNLKDHYGPVTDGFCRGNPACGYLQRIANESGVNVTAITGNLSLLSKLDHYCYNNLWENLPLLQKGASQMTLQIKNTDESGEIIKEYPVNVPYSATLINSQKIKDYTQGTFYAKFLPKNTTSVSIPQNSCQKAQKSAAPSQDTLHVPSFLSRIWSAIGHVIHPGQSKIITKTASTQIQTNPELYEANINTGKISLQFTPKNAQSTEDVPDSYFAPNPQDQDDNLRLPAPGNPGALNDVRSKYLVPKSQQVN